MCVLCLLVLHLAYVASLVLSSTCPRMLDALTVAADGTPRSPAAGKAVLVRTAAF
jgi:hypothetical protein